MPIKDALQHHERVLEIAASAHTQNYKPLLGVLYDEVCRLDKPPLQYWLSAFALSVHQGALGRHVSKDG